MGASLVRLPRLSVAVFGSKSSSESVGKGHARSDLRRRQSVQARILARDLLPPGDWRITADGDGRPVILDSDDRPGPDLSISHSGRWVAAALADQGRIGVDLEVPRPGRDILGIAERYFSQAECRVVAAEGEPALLAFWTMREAIAKALGGGLAQALALDGTGLVGGRNGSCREDDLWAVAHQDCGDVHLAVAWSVAAAAPELPGLLDAAFRALHTA
jgi:phosphopantetheinyl transferase